MLGEQTTPPAGRGRDLPSGTPEPLTLRSGDGSPKLYWQRRVFSATARGRARPSFAHCVGRPCSLQMPKEFTVRTDFLHPGGAGHRALHTRAPGKLSQPFLLSASALGLCIPVSKTLCSRLVSSPPPFSAFRCLISARVTHFLPGLSPLPLA